MCIRDSAGTVHQVIQGIVDGTGSGVIYPDITSFPVIQWIHGVVTVSYTHLHLAAGNAAGSNRLPTGRYGAIPEASS